MDYIIVSAVSTILGFVVGASITSYEMLKFYRKEFK